MPYRKIILSDGKETETRRVDWKSIALTVSPDIFRDMRSALSGSDGGKWTVFTTTLSSGNKLHVSNGKEVLENVGE
jgi:hypothetical protein